MAKWLLVPSLCLVGIMGVAATVLQLYVRYTSGGSATLDGEPIADYGGLVVAFVMFGAMIYGSRWLYGRSVRALAGAAAPARHAPEA